MENFKETAVELAHEAGKIMKQNFVLGMKKEWKSDNTPLTATDLAINDLVIKTISEKYPTHSIIGEEGSKLVDGSEYAWVCDPVDGTAAFSHGYPTFVFSLALTKNGESILGVIYDPIMDRLLIGEKNLGATLNGEKIMVSNHDSFLKACINIDGDSSFNKLRTVLMDQSCWVSTIHSAVYAGLLVACGEFVAEIFAYKNPWDGAALKIIVEEAGGKVTDIAGNEQRWDQKINGFVASNGVLHEKIIEKIKLMNEA